MKESPLHASEEAEQMLLGKMLLDNRTYDRLAGDLTARHFAFPVHGLIFEEIGAMRMRGVDASPVTMRTWAEACNQLKHLGGMRYLAELCTSDLGTEAGSLVATLRRLYHARATLAATVRVREALHDREFDPDAVVGRFVAEVHDAVRGGEGLKAVDADEGRRNIWAKLSQPALCHSTGFRTLDRLMAGGLYPGKAYAIAARRKHGKSLILGAVSQHLGQQGVRHLFICSESGHEEIITRQWAKEVGLNSLDFLQRPLSPRLKTMMMTALDKGSKEAFFIDLFNPNLEDLQAAVLLGIARYRPKGIIFDYLQLVRGRAPGVSQAEHLDEVAQWLANIPRQHGVWTLTAAQLNKEGGIRGGEGLLLAFDHATRLARIENANMPDGIGLDAYLEIAVSRYTRGDLKAGDEKTPALGLDQKVGPHFFELPDVPGATPDQMALVGES